MRSIISECEKYWTKESVRLADIHVSLKRRITMTWVVWKGSEYLELCPGYLDQDLTWQPEQTKAIKIDAEDIPDFFRGAQLAVEAAEAFKKDLAEGDE